METLDLTETGNGRGKDDPLYEKASMIVRANRRASISLIQRHLRIGYNRAAWILEAMVGDVIDKFSPDAKILPERPKN